MIVPSPVPDAGANFNAELGHDALHEALEVTVMRLVPAGSKRRSAGASESVTSAEAAGAGHGDGFAGSLARSGAHPDLDGRSPGHVQHPESPVADARRRIDRHGRRGRLPIDLPRAVGHHADGIVGVVGFVEGERFGFDGGIGVVRRVVTAAGGENSRLPKRIPRTRGGGG